MSLRSLSSLLLPLLLLRCAAAEPTAQCNDVFRSGAEDFVLDSEDAVTEGAVILDSAQVPSADACQSVCCERARCNLALLDLRFRGAEEAQNVTCVLFNCIHRNRFVCRFVNLVGYRSFIRESVFLKHLQGPGGDGESYSANLTDRSNTHIRGHLFTDGDRLVLSLRRILIIISSSPHVGAGQTVL